MGERIRQTLMALQKEHEASLAFLYGRRIGDTSVLQQPKRIWNGVVFRVLIFFRRILRALTIRPQAYRQADILLFAGSNNQYQSLESTYTDLLEQQASLLLLCDNTVSMALPADAERIAFSVGDALVALAVLATRFVGLLQRLRTEKNRLAIHLHLNQFLYAYIFIPYFFRVLKGSGVRMVVLANDHNVENRCLRLAAEMAGIKTAYLQHASVSELFPPLEFDYAFLDGEQSLFQYRQAIAFAQARGEAVRHYPACIFLSGQKKKLVARPVEPASAKPAAAFCIGVALNQLDNVAAVIAFIEGFADSDICFLLRPHPSQYAGFLAVLRQYTARHGHIQISVASREPVQAFLARCHMLVAANSSIHLEAALSGLATFYHEFGHQAQHADYYGYVASGLARPLPASIHTMTRADLQTLSEAITEKTAIIRKYSETYHSCWQGREGELVATTLMALLDGQDVGHLYDCDYHEQAFQAICRLPASAWQG